MARSIITLIMIAAIIMTRTVLCPSTFSQYDACYDYYDSCYHCYYSIIVVVVIVVVVVDVIVM